jgi:hypothetical protein
MDFRQRQGDILGLDPDSPSAAYPVSGDDPVTPAGGRNLIDGSLKFCPKRVGAVVQAALQEFDADINAQFLGSGFDIECQHGTRDHVWFFVFQ